MEPQPHRAALRPHPPHRPDRGLPPLEPGGRGDPRGRCLPHAAGEAGAGAPGARRPGVRRARQAPVRGQAAARPADRGDPLRRAARGARPPHHRSWTTRFDREPAAGPARRARAGPRRHGRQPRPAHPRGDGAGRGPPPAAALHRVVLPRGVPAAGRHGQAARAAPLRGHPRPGAGAQPRPADRHRRAGAAALRAHRLREGAGRAAGPAAGRLRLPGPSAARRRPSTSRSSATATCCGAAPCWWTSATRARSRACSSTWSTPSRTPASRARASGASSPSGCSTSSSTPTATRATCTTRPTSTTGRWPKDEPGVEAILDRPECAWITPRAGAEGAGPRGRARRAGAPGGGARRASSR